MATSDGTTDNSQASGLADRQRTPIELPDWTPPAVVTQARRIEARNLPDSQWVILHRLATDPRMQNVWRELTRHDRQNGQFLHPAKGQEAQADALGRLFFFSFSAARDEIGVSKPGDDAPLREALLKRIATLREIADELTTPELSGPRAHWAAAFRYFAEWLEGGFLTLRPPNDPLMVKKHRGDPVDRGVQILLGAQLEDTFGKRLDGTAATIAAVALGKTKLSPRVARSAFSGRKTTQ